MAETPAPPPVPTQSPAMDVVPPPANQPQPPIKKPEPPKPAAPAAPAKPKTPPKQGVTAAIIGTVVIVLGLAVLAVIAYMQSK